VADLVAKVAEQRAVRLAHLHPNLLPKRIVRLGDVDGDHAVVVARAVLGDLEPAPRGFRTLRR
jgi:hypothetical protein